ncbi:uncharacterized protein LOC119980697 [Tripterygium wilfordii]|uniref:uncharacterized protein LOC119980697 n=1 Tax=Tripterygium wilfordii TaxID=458696 RepID=UPI0018F80FBF|nr:uncharacterized protein LOC119980697 [Tripterygium wilfordii]
MTFLSFTTWSAVSPRLSTLTTSWSPWVSPHGIPKTTYLHQNFIFFGFRQYHLRAYILQKKPSPSLCHLSTPSPSPPHVAVTTGHFRCRCRSHQHYLPSLAKLISILLIHPFLRPSLRPHHQRHLLSQLRSSSLVVDASITIPCHWKKLYLPHIIPSLTSLNMKWPWTGAYCKKVGASPGQNCRRKMRMKRVVRVPVISLKMFDIPPDDYLLEKIWTETN